MPKVRTHRSGLGPWKRLRSGSAAMLLSMTARGARILAKRTQSGSMRASEGPTSAAQNYRRVISLFLACYLQ
jgi:hypothetical protein